MHQDLGHPEKRKRGLDGFRLGEWRTPHFFLSPYAYKTQALASTTAIALQT